MEWNDRLLHDTGSWRNEFASYGRVANWTMSYPSDVRITAKDLAAISSPTLIVWGEDEPYGGREAAERVAATMPHARLDYRPGVGHLPWLDEPEAVAAEMRALMADLRPAA